MLNFLPTLAHADESCRSKVEEIYRNYHELMYKVTLRKLSCSTDAAYKAEDAVQNAFLKIISHFEAICFDGGEDRLRAYVVSIAIHDEKYSYSIHCSEYFLQEEISRIILRVSEKK